MGWGIDFTADIYLSRQNYHENVYEVEEEIESLKEENQDIKERMLMMIIGGVNSVILKDEDGYNIDGVDALHQKFTEWLKLYDENNIKIYELQAYKEYLENKENE